MPLNEEAVLLKLENLVKNLPPKQVEFLEMRRVTKSDAEAARQIGAADTSIPRWKKNPDFFKAYVIVTMILEANRETVVSDVSRQKVVKSQEAALLTYLPKAVQSHIDIMVNGKSDEFKLRAIKMLYDYTGIGPSSGPPIGKQNQAFLNIIDLIAPQAKSEAVKRGLDVDTSITDIVDKAKEENVEAIPDMVEEEGDIEEE